MLNLVDDVYIEEAMPQNPRSLTDVNIRNKKRLRSRVRLILPIAAIIVMLTAVCGIATYEYWSMPEQGESYKGDYLQVHSKQEYELPSDEDFYEEKTQLSDEWFINQAASVLKIVNKWEINATNLTVTRRTNQRRNREEVVVSLSAEGQKCNATFDAENGALISATAFDKEYAGELPMAEEDALKCAEEYYNSLPYPKGYEYSHLSKFDDHAWMFSFSKAVSVEVNGKKYNLFSDYEQVRITIDPCSGSFQLSNSFYTPLLDDHTPEQKAITSDEAVNIVANSGIVPNMHLWELTVSLCICKPDPGRMALHNGNHAEDEYNFKDYSISRIAWEIECVRDNGIFESGFHVYVDLYTGEVLNFSAY